MMSGAATGAATGPATGAAEIFGAFVTEHLYGVVGACSDDVAKIEKELRNFLEDVPDAALTEIAPKLASLSNWWVHEAPFIFEFEGHAYAFRCTEQLMMARKITEFFGYTGEAARAWLTRLADAEGEWLQLKEECRQDSSKSMPRFSDRCWPGLVKHFGRILTPLDESLEPAACAEAFTQANKTRLQQEIQEAKRRSGEPSFCFVLDAIAEWNRNHPQKHIYLCEATAQDVHYSINADYFGQVLPVMRSLVQDGALERGAELLARALQVLEKNFDPAVKNKKSVAAGISQVGDDALGAALRHCAKRRRADEELILGESFAEPLEVRRDHF